MRYTMYFLCLPDQLNTCDKKVEIQSVMDFNRQIKGNIVGAVKFVLMYYIYFTGNFTVNKCSYQLQTCGISWKK